MRKVLRRLDEAKTIPGFPGGPVVDPPVSTAARRLPRLRKRPWRFLHLATVAVTAFFAYVALSDIKLARVWHALQMTDYLLLIPAVAAFALGALARALRWRSLFPHGRRPSRTSVANAMTVGYFYNNILPARAGEAARVLVLIRRSSSPPAEVISTVVLERLYDVVAILLIFFIAEPWLPHVSWFGPAAIVAVVLAGVIGVTVAVLTVYGERAVGTILRPLRRFRPFSGDHLTRTIEEITHGLSGLRRGPVALEALAWTLAAWMLSALCAYIITLSFKLHVDFAGGVLVVVAVGLSMILPSPPGAIGVYEGAALIGLKAYPITHSVALSYALMLHAVNFLPFLLVGFPLLQYNARHPRRRRIMAEAAGAVGP